ncbi:M1 family metallopeptidase [Leifsonia sp. A12D58]|uniref:M1 family metallopeptidase n=1 Tax=Leifsonia sp. A12D58 TaxID=3397674 RepID=UPI0039DFC644
MKTADETESYGAATSGDPYLPHSGNGGYLVSHYAVDLNYRVSNNRLLGTAIISATATHQLSRFSLDLTGLVAQKVRVNGVRAPRFTHNANKLIITPARPLERGERFTVTVRYGGAPAPRKSLWGDVGWEELTEGVLVAGQPCGAPTWFPCNDHPSNKATFGLTITTDSPYHVVACGTLISRSVKASQTVWVFETTEPVATYLATVQIGYYSRHPLAQGTVPQQAYIPADLADEFTADFGAQPAMLAYFSQVFGDYPFAEYSVVVADDDLEIPLEAHGLSVFGRNHVDGQQGSTRLIAHELAHSWFGNSLTASSWKHIWLHEGFACYAEWLWSEQSGGQSTNRLAEAFWTKLSSLPQNIVLGDPGPRLMFDDRVYKRGALTLHALRLTIGDEPFFRMLRDWTLLKRHGSVTTAEFLAHASGYTDRPLGPLMSSWLFDTALPKLPRGYRPS